MLNSARRRRDSTSTSRVCCSSVITLWVRLRAEPWSFHELSSRWKIFSWRRCRGSGVRPARPLSWPLSALPSPGLVSRARQLLRAVIFSRLTWTFRSGSVPVSTAPGSWGSEV